MSAASELNQGLASLWPGPEEALRETEGRFRGIFFFSHRTSRPEFWAEVGGAAALSG